MRLIDADELRQLALMGDVSPMQKLYAAACADATPTINPYEWISVTERLPESSDNFVLAVVNGKYGNITFQNAIQIADYSKREGWFVDGYEHLGPVNVTHWMPLPKGPEGEEQK